MALSGIVESTYWNFEDGRRRNVVLKWDATQNTSENSSTINWTLSGGGSDSGSVVVSEIRVTINNDIVFYRDTTNHTQCRFGTVLATGSKKIYHNSDGTKSFTAKIEAGIYNWSINKSGENTFTLNTIARASSIDSAMDVTLGERCNISWYPQSTSFKYKLRFVLNKYAEETGFINPNTTNKYTYTNFVMPLDIAHQITNSQKGKMTVYLFTFSSDGSQIGSIDSKVFNVFIPKNLEPSVKNQKFTLVNENSTVASWNIGLAGYSKARIEANGSAQYSATVKKFSIIGSYETIQYGSSLNFVTPVINSSGNIGFSIQARDSRDIYSKYFSTNIIKFYPYSKPKVLSFNVWRDNSIKVYVNANWDYSSVENKNNANAKLYYKKSSDISWIEYGSINKNTDIILSKTFEETSSYKFKIIVTDSLNNSAEEEGFISTADVTMDFSDNGKGIGIGKICESDSFEVNFPSKFFKDVYLNGELYKNNKLVKIPIEDETHKGCFYLNVGNEKAWFNPPMELNTEYRTLDNMNGSPIYTALLDVGAPGPVGNPPKGRFIIANPKTDFGLTGITKIISYAGYWRTKGWALPYISKLQTGSNDEEKYRIYISARADVDEIAVYTGSDLPSRTIYVYIRYLKE